MKENEKVHNWISSLGLTPTSEYWDITFTLSSTAMEKWLYRRNKLKPQDTRISLSVRSFGQWVVHLERHDKLYESQWRANNDFRVESQQMKYSTFIKWPKLNNIEDFPKLIKPIEEALNIKFIEHVDVTSDKIDLNPHINTKSKLFEWFSGCSKTIGTNMSGN